MPSRIQRVVRTLRFAPVTLFVIAVVLWIAVAGVALRARGLRPIADDYCSAAYASDGFFGGLAAYYQTWAGDLVQLGISNILVGQPLLHLPFSVASAIPFLITAATVTVALVVTLAGALPRPWPRRRLALFAGVPLALVLWWAYWWLPAALAPDQSGTPWLLASAMLNWQIVNVQYALLPSLLLVAWLFINERAGASLWLRLVATGVLAVACGMSGIVLAISLLVFVPLMIGLRAIVVGRWDRTWALIAGVFVVGCALGLVVAFTAPGVAVRASGLVPQLTDVSPLGIIAWVFPTAIVAWLEGIVTPGVLLVGVVAALASFAAASKGIQLELRRLTSLGAALVLFSLVLSLAARVGAGFSYQAYWHRVMPQTMLFFAVVLLAVALGATVAPFVPKPSRLAVVAGAGVVLVALGVSWGALAAMEATVSVREVAWSIGPAPMGAEDIEAAWVKPCYEVFKDSRDVPDRGGF